MKFAVESREKMIEQTVIKQFFVVINKNSIHEAFWNARRV